MDRNHPTAAPVSAGFTLIELLIVVAIISILAAIAVPNFLEAQTRAKVSHAKNGLRTLKTALESYRTDNNKFPIRRNLKTYGTLVTPEAGTRLEQLSVLTTPIAYISSLPVDVFEKNLAPPNNVLDYWDAQQFFYAMKSWETYRANFPVENQHWVCMSVGPDGYLGVSLNNSYGWPISTNGKLVNTIKRSYDPTNGTVSPGNIYGGGVADANNGQGDLIDWGHNLYYDIAHK